MSFLDSLILVPFEKPSRVGSKADPMAKVLAARQQLEESLDDQLDIAKTGNTIQKRVKRVRKVNGASQSLSVDIVVTPHWINTGTTGLLFPLKYGNRILKAQAGPNEGKDISVSVKDVKHLIQIIPKFIQATKEGEFDSAIVAAYARAKK